MDWTYKQGVSEEEKMIKICYLKNWPIFVQIV